MVTPCVGVWIETVKGNRVKGFDESHPAWVCGLKHMVRTQHKTAPVSHPAWVCGLKPTGTTGTLPVLLSHPAWVCGLKLENLDELADTVQSHPAWVCGLKLVLKYVISYCQSHTLRGCVD